MEKQILYVGFSRSIVFFRIGSLIIRLAENGNSWKNLKTWFNLFHSSHVFLIYPAHRFRPFYLVSEAAGQQIRFMSQFNFEKHSLITKLYKLEVDLLMYKAIKMYSEIHAGAPYAFLENLGIAWVRIVRLILGRSIANPFGSGEGAQKCSELIIRNVVLRILAAQNIDLNALSIIILKDRKHELPKDIENIGVRDVYEILEWFVTNELAERVENLEPQRVESLRPAA